MSDVDTYVDVGVMCAVLVWTCLVVAKIVAGGTG